MSSWGQSVRDLTGQLNQFGNLQRGIAQTDIANLRANEMLNLSKESSALQSRAEKLQEERFGQQVKQEKQNQAVGGLKSILTMEMGMPSDTATNIINYVASSKGVPTISPQVNRVITPEIISKLRTRLGRETINDLPPVWRDYIMGPIGSSANPQPSPKLQDFKPSPSKDANIDRATEAYKRAVPQNLPGVMNTNETPIPTETPIAGVELKNPEVIATQLMRLKAIQSKKDSGLILTPAEEEELRSGVSQLHVGFPQQ
jgi:hypothetical protein